MANTTSPTSSNSQSLSGVIDLSFLNYSEDDELDKIVESRLIKLYTTIEIIYEAKAIRLSNNKFTNILDILTVLSKYVNKLEQIIWLDLSFNEINCIPKELLIKCPNLTTLYLQVNNITKLFNIKLLSQLPALKTFAMFGNPIEENKVSIYYRVVTDVYSYKVYIIYMMYYVVLCCMQNLFT